MQRAIQTVLSTVKPQLVLLQVTIKTHRILVCSAVNRKYLLFLLPLVASPKPSPKSVTQAESTAVSSLTHHTFVACEKLTPNLDWGTYLTIYPPTPLPRRGWRSLIDVANFYSTKKENKLWPVYAVQYLVCVCVTCYCSLGCAWRKKIN
jgi:hypothetical protein